MSSLQFRAVSAADQPGSSFWGEPSEVLARLVGCWSLDRKIAGQGSMRGVATVEAGADGWTQYFEAGRLRLDIGESFDATRRYSYRALPTGFAIFFSEAPPRLFHEVRLEPAPEGLRGQATHLCGNDLYRTDYVFRPDGSFSVRHAIQGPRKAYAIVTCYRRVALP